MGFFVHMDHIGFTGRYALYGKFCDGDL